MCKFCVSFQRLPKIKISERQNFSKRTEKQYTKAYEKYPPFITAAIPTLFRVPSKFRFLKRTAGLPAYNALYFSTNFHIHRIPAPFLPTFSAVKDGSAFLRLRGQRSNFFQISLFPIKRLSQKAYRAFVFGCVFILQKNACDVKRFLSFPFYKEFNNSSLVFTESQPHDTDPGPTCEPITGPIIVIIGVTPVFI